jgi:hypothetical protein
VVIGDLGTNTQLYLCYPAAGRGRGEREVLEMVAEEVACVTVSFSSVRLCSGVAYSARYDQKGAKRSHLGHRSQLSATSM